MKSQATPRKNNYKTKKQSDTRTTYGSLTKTNQNQEKIKLTILQTIY